jgi:hypothetical protein
MFYTIKVTCRDRLVFETAARRTTRDQAIVLFKLLRDKFPDFAGYHVRVVLLQKYSTDITRRILKDIG